MWGIIYLIRHTRLKIKEGICYGSTDIDLADSFLEEAELIREKFKDIPIGRVYCSPLNRCKKLAECFKRRIIFDNRLIEMDFGDWEGVSWNEVFQEEEGKRWFANYIDEKCPNGESYRDLHKRVESFVKEIPLDAKATLIITHSGVIRAFLSVLNITTPEESFSIEISYGQIIKIKDGDYKLL